MKTFSLPVPSVLVSLTSSLVALCASPASAGGVVLGLALAAGLFSAPASAQDLDVEVQGMAEYDFVSYYTPRDGYDALGRNQGMVRTDLRAWYGYSLHSYARVEARADQAEWHRSRVFLEEAYVEVYFDDVDLRIGRQINTWGRADFYNATDNLTSFDYTDLLESDEEKLGQWSVRAAGFFGDWQVEAVVVPFLYVPSQMPQLDNRWFTPLPETAPNPEDPSSPLDVRYDLQDAVEPDVELASTQGAIRVARTIRGWDVSVSYYEGWNDVPVYQTTPTRTPNGPVVRITPKHYRLRSAGADASTSFGSYTVRGEAAFLDSDAPGEDPYVQYAVGLDRTFGGFDTAGSTFVLVQWMDDLSGAGGGGQALDLTHVFRRALLSRVEYQPTTKWTTSLEGLVRFGEGDFLVQSEAEYQATGDLSLNLSAAFLGGPDDTLFGGFDENRRIQLLLQYKL